MEKKSRKATKNQRERINNMLESGLIDRHRAQMIIAGDEDSPLEFWEGRYPGKGKELMSVLGPFYGWRFKRKPQIADLEPVVRQIVFWQKFDRVRVFTDVSPYDHETMANTFWNAYCKAQSAKHLLFEYRRLEFAAAMNWSLGETWHSLGATLQDWLFYSVGFMLSSQPEEAAKLKPFLDLNLAGNRIDGFDYAGNVLVSVASQ